MTGSLFIAECLATPWALMPERLQALATVLTRARVGHAPDAESLAHVDADRLAREQRRSAAQSHATGSIAVLPLYGVLSQRGNLIEQISGAGSMSTQQFAQRLRAALADESVAQILIDIDSPGGSVYGVTELAEEIYRARDQKPIVAIANSLAASAAYWVASAASECYVTPGGEVGSIGVWQAHQDFSRALAEAGVETTLIAAGKYKVEGHPYGALDTEAQAFLQSRVDEYYAAFTKAVARGRAVPIAAVREGMGQGRVLGAEAALAERMVDGVASFDEVLAHMRRSIQANQPKPPSRLRQAQASLAVLG